MQILFSPFPHGAGRGIIENMKKLTHKKCFQYIGYALMAVGLVGGIVMGYLFRVPGYKLDGTPTKLFDIGLMFGVLLVGLMLGAFFWGKGLGKK